MGLEKPWQLAVCATDTVWGLLCRIDTDLAQQNIKRIYEIKQRERSKPLILFGISTEVLKPYIKEWSPLIDQLAKKHWPGALTIIIERSEKLPGWVNPGEQFIGLRIPNSKSVMQLLKQTNGVVLSTSANLSGEAPVSNYAEASVEFAETTDLILKPDISEELSNKASTIIKIMGDEITVLREGDIKLEQLR